jgi:recombinase
VDLVPEEAEAVRRCYESYLAGRSMPGIAQDLNEAGLTTTFGNP